MLLEFLAGYLIGRAIGEVISIVVDAFLDEDALEEEILGEYDDAFYILIQEKKANAITVGIFDEDVEVIETGVEVSSDEGVSDSFYEGQVLELHS